MYIYEIKPVLFLDLSVDMQENIINIYNQFLRECDFNLQIIISNRKLDINNYIDKYLGYKKNIKLSMYNMYVEDIKEKLIHENIFETRTFVTFSENAKEESNKEQKEKIIYKLEEIGCKIEKIKGIKNIEEVLYKFLNK